MTVLTQSNWIQFSFIWSLNYSVNSSLIHVPICYSPILPTTHQYWLTIVVTYTLNSSCWRISFLLFILENLSFLERNLTNKIPDYDCAIHRWRDCLLVIHNHSYLCNFLFMQFLIHQQLVGLFSYLPVPYFSIWSPTYYLTTISAGV